jgi:competence protein ComEC
VGVGAGVAGRPFPAWAGAALVLAGSPPLAPLAFGAAGWLAASTGRGRTEVAPGSEVVLEGRIVSVPAPASGDRVRFLLRDGHGGSVEATVPTAPWPLALGDAIRIRARLRTPPSARNPGGRDPAERLRAEGVALQAVAVWPAVRIAPPSPLAWLERARARFAAAATTQLPPREAALVRAIGAGDAAALDPATTEAFARSGLAHVLAVSGLHLVVVAFGLERMLRAVFLRVDALAARVDPRRLSAAVAIPATLLYALATGAGVPILRAAVAAAVAFAGALLDREHEPVNTLALAAMAILAGDPGALLSPSLQLSFASVGGIALWAGPLRRVIPVPRPAPGTWRARLVEPLLAGACTTLAASAATAPILALHFRQLPLLGAIANVAGVPVGSALTVAATAAAVGAAVAPALAAPFLWAAWPLAWTLLRLAELAAAPDWSVVGVGSPGAVGAVGAYALALAAGRLRGAARMGAAALACACVLLPAPLRALAARARGGLEVTFLSVGQGDAALLRLPDGAAVLVDGGGAAEGGADPGARDVVPFLRDLGVRRLAAVFVSHPHADHVLGLAAVGRAVAVERLFTNGDPGDAAAAAVLASLPPAEPLAPGDAWERGGVEFQVRGGPRAGLGTNDASLVLRVAYHRTAVLFPGDLEAEGETAAAAAGGLDADAVKVPHHGSGRSSGPSLVAAVRPRFAIASVGAGNRYRFPHPQALDRWRAAGATILRTDEGAVRLLSDGRAISRVPAGRVLDPLATWRERP